MDHQQRSAGSNGVQQGPFGSVVGRPEEGGILHRHQIESVRSQPSVQQTGVQPTHLDPRRFGCR